LVVGNAAAAVEDVVGVGGVEGMLLPRKNILLLL
jgi:hypothetical protein